MTSVCRRLHTRQHVDRLPKMYLHESLDNYILSFLLKLCSIPLKQEIKFFLRRNCNRNDSVGDVTVF